MSLINCPECTKEFSSLAASCPNCGAPNEPVLSSASRGMGRGTKILLAIVGIPVVIIAILLVIGANISPEEQERQSAATAIDLCDKQANDELSPVNVRRFARATCERMRSDYRSKYGRDY